MILIEYTYIDDETKFICTETDRFQGSLVEALAEAADKISTGMTEQIVDLRFRCDAPS